MSELSNRRQRQKKLEKDLKEAQAKHTPVPSPKATIPSPSHDITVTVPFIDPRDAGYPIHEGYNFVGHVDSINVRTLT